jgi:hypothetical protein
VRLGYMVLWLVFLALFAGAASAHVFDTMDVSSKARGMGGAWTANAFDATAVFYNPACMPEIGATDAYATYFKPNTQSFTGLTFLAFSFPLRSGQSVGISYRGFGVEYEGVDLLNESTLSVAYALSLLKDIHTALYIGSTVNVYSLEFGSSGGQELGSQTTAGVDVGVLGVLRDRTRIGLLMHNVNQPSVGKVISEPLPQWVSAGISYKPYFGVVTELDVRSVRGEDVEVHMGMQFDVTDYFAMRFGFQTQPNSLTGGLSVGIEPVKIDYSYSSHSVLPGTHHVALGARF